MFLKSVELYGFKSFADRTKFDFAEGITALLGPNGSGKSNVVDSIKWVLGSQSLSAVRAGKREDVIFNGTDNRKPMPMCEVILTLNNEENILNIQATEVEIKRRMFRNGDNEYYINRERALLRNVKELFMDTGVGKTAYSILEQGKIDQILSLKPEDRRYIFEEAAGISRFKQEGEVAARKLERTDENMAQAEILFREEEKKYNSRKVQMDRLLKSRELTARKEKVEVELQLSYVQSLSKFYKFKEDEIEKDRKQYAELEQSLSSQRTDMDRFESEISSLREQKEELNASLSRTDEQKNGIRKELDLLNERYHDVHERTKQAQFKAQQVQDRLDRDRKNFNDKQAELENIKESIRQIDLSIDKTIAEIAKITKEREEYGNQIEQLNTETDKLADERIAITQKISDLANSIANRLEENIKGSGYSSTLRAKAEKSLFDELAKAKKILSERLEFLKGMSSVDFDHTVYLKALEETDEDIKCELDEIKGLFQEYSGTIPIFIDEFTAPEGTLAEKSKLDKELQDTYTKESENKNRITELQGEIDRKGKMLILKDSDLNDLKIEKTQYSTRGQSLKIQIEEMRTTLQQSEFDFSDAKVSIEGELARESETLNMIEEAKARQNALSDQLEQLKADIDVINVKIESKAEEYNSYNSKFKDQFDRKQELMTKLAAEKENLKNINENIQKIYTDFFDNTGKSLKEFDDHEITQSVEDLKNEAEDVKKKLQDLGYINYMAEEEFNEAKKNYEFYKQNLDDLRKSKEDLEEVIAQIKQKSEELFMDTYSNISVAFEEMFSILFGGGHAKLSLTDEEHILESGIEITAQPPGKKPSSLTLLSGGEKSMTAVALLFATYKVKPSPFCILDEIDAALDAKNIGSFMRVLETFGDKSQFIIITHNKGTVMGASSLLGVTQEELGVSKMISYKLDTSEDTGERTLKN